MLMLSRTKQKGALPVRDKIYALERAFFTLDAIAHESQFLAIRAFARAAADDILALLDELQQSGAFDAL